LFQTGVGLGEVMRAEVLKVRSHDRTEREFIAGRREGRERKGLIFRRFPDFTISLW
jgi:hypothetical protein